MKIGFTENSKLKRCIRRAIKLLVFVICTAGFFYHTWTFLQLYLTYPTSLDTSEEYPDSFSVPAITLCNKNRLMRQQFCRRYPERCTWEHTTWKTFCDAYRKQCPDYKPENFTFGIPEFVVSPYQKDSNTLLNAVGPQEEVDLILQCDLGLSALRDPCNPSIMIQVPKNAFPYKCFSFFSLLGKQHEEPLNWTFTDEYTIVLNMHPEEYMHTHDSVQASVVIHDPRKLVNPMTEGVTLSAGNFYHLFPTMEIRESLPLPYDSDCKDYLNEWKKNGGYGPLSKKDCINICKIKAMVDEYDCVGQTITYPHNYNICPNPSNDASPELNRRCTSSCRDACKENIYHFTSEFIADLSPMCDNVTDEYCKNEYLYITVKFSRMTVQKFRQIPRFESIELFGYIGGYLGMWLGISVASLYEFVETICGVMAYPFLKGKKMHKTTTPIELSRRHTAQKLRIRKNANIDAVNRLPV